MYKNTTSNERLEYSIYHKLHCYKEEKMYKLKARGVCVLRFMYKVKLNINEIIK